MDFGQPAERVPLPRPPICDLMSEMGAYLAGLCRSPAGLGRAGAGADPPLFFLPLAFLLIQCPPPFGMVKLEGEAGSGYSGLDRSVSRDGM